MENNKNNKNTQNSNHNIMNTNTNTNTNSNEEMNKFKNVIEKLKMFDSDLGDYMEYRTNTIRPARQQILRIHDVYGYFIRKIESFWDFLKSDSEITEDNYNEIYEKYVLDYDEFNRVHDTSIILDGYDDEDIRDTYCEYLIDSIQDYIYDLDCETSFIYRIINKYEEGEDFSTETYGNDCQCNMYASKSVTTLEYAREINEKNEEQLEWLLRYMNDDVDFRRRFERYSILESHVDEAYQDLKSTVAESDVFNTSEIDNHLEYHQYVDDYSELVSHIIEYDIEDADDLKILTPKIYHYLSLIAQPKKWYEIAYDVGIDGN